MTYDQLEKIKAKLNSPNSVQPWSSWREDVRWLTVTVEQHRYGEKAFINEQRRLNSRLHWVYEQLSSLLNPKSFEITEVVDRIKDELIQFRADASTPLSDTDRVSGIIENVSNKVYNKQAREDISWLTQEIGRLRALIKRVNFRLGQAVWASPPETDDTNHLVDTAVRHLRGKSVELSEIHDILAAALHYERAPSAKEDPDCPCPGDYITGDHIAVTLAAEAAQQINTDQETIIKLGASVDCAVAQLTDMEREVADLRRRRSNPLPNSHNQAPIWELEQLRAYTKCTCVYQEHLNEIWPSPDCEVHGVEAHDAKHRGQLAINELALLRSLLLGKPHQDGQ